jgi:hypothetical protein
MQKNYRAYLFDRDDKVVAIETFCAGDDAFALLKARQFGSRGGFELWRSGDWIAHVTPDGSHARCPSAPDPDLNGSLNGLYKLDVQSDLPRILGTLALLDGAIRGGHATFAVTGKYYRRGDSVSGLAYGLRHTTVEGPGLFPVDHIRLQCDGWIFADHIEARGTAAELPGIEFEIQLTRLSG